VAAPVAAPRPVVTTATEPDVRVTIGRLEVRNGSTPAATEPRARPSGLRSLEEYGAAREARR